MYPDVNCFRAEMCPCLFGFHSAGVAAGSCASCFQSCCYAGWWIMISDQWSSLSYKQCSWSNSKILAAIHTSLPWCFPSTGTLHLEAALHNALALEWEDLDGATIIITITWMVYRIIIPITWNQRLGWCIIYDILPSLPIASQQPLDENSVNHFAGAAALLLSSRSSG